MSVLGRGAHSGRKGTPEHPGSYRRIHRAPGNHKSTHEAWVARAVQKKERVSLLSTENRTSFYCFPLCPGGLQTSEGTNKIWSLPPYQNVFIGRRFISSVFINRIRHHWLSGHSPCAYLDTLWWQHAPESKAKGEVSDLDWEEAKVWATERARDQASALFRAIMKRKSHFLYFNFKTPEYIFVKV